jgi:hypothetical protein
MRFSDLARSYGWAIAAAASLPAVIYVGSALAVPQAKPPFIALRPDETAVRAMSGPTAPAIEAVRPPRPIPETVKGIYVTSLTAGSPRLFGRLVDLVDRTELNALVIDVKNGNGELAFEPKDEGLKPFVEKTPALGNLEEFTAPLREKGIYLIARVFVFQDPAHVARRPDLAIGRKGGGIWRDNRGTPWVDPASFEAWKYTVAVAREAYDGGFDEIQFDYIRFPSDGSLGTIEYRIHDGSKKIREEVLADFFAYLDKELRQKRRIPISADLFGLVMVQHDNDLGIGQRLEPAARKFDVISPMVYPSHYASGFGGFANPASYPYEVVRDSMTEGKKVFDKLLAERERFRQENPSTVPPKVASLRPWLQDFDLGADYTPAMVRAQIRAAMEGGASGWLIWNAKNVYSEGAFELEKRE